MILLLNILLVTTVFTIPPVFPTPKASERLLVEVKNVQVKPNSKIRVSVFIESSFLKEPVASKVIDASGPNAVLGFDLPNGDYAVSTYQDLNANGKMDRYFYGPPKEPYGFSNNVKPSFGPPDYSECKISLGNEKKTIVINLIN